MLQLNDARVAASWAFVTLCAVVLTGCAPTGDGLTLVKTKSQVQLLRNEVANRIGAEMVDSVKSTEDVSEACLTEAQNPSGRIRNWKSSVSVALTPEADQEETAAALVTSFVDQGWVTKAFAGTSASALTLLTNPASLAEIEIYATARGGGPTVVVSVHGPCVETAGPESNEVLSLEGAK